MAGNNIFDRLQGHLQDPNDNNAFERFQSNFKPKKKNLKQQIDALIAARPDYEISPEAGENQDIARANAFGRDRAFQSAEQEIEQGAADSAGQAQGVSSSSAGLLSALGTINEQKNAALRGNARDESMAQTGKVRDYYGANMAVIDENDKAFDYNVNQPYQLKMEELRMRRKARQENAWRALDSVAAIGTMGLSGRGGVPA